MGCAGQATDAKERGPVHLPQSARHAGWAEKGSWRRGWGRVCGQLGSGEGPGIEPRNCGSWPCAVFPRCRPLPGEPGAG